MQSTAVEQIQQMRNEWNNHQDLLDTLRESGEKTHLEPVVVPTLSQLGRNFLQRKENMARFLSRPLEQQIPPANMLPNNMTSERYLAQLQQNHQNGILDEQTYRNMQGLSPLPPPSDLLPQPSEEEQAQLLTDGSQTLIDGAQLFAYQQRHYTASMLMQQSPDQYCAPASPVHHDSSSYIPAEPYGTNLENTDRQLNGTEHPTTVLTAPLHPSSTPAARPPPTPTQIINTVGEQNAEQINQDQLDPTASFMPQQTMETGMGMGHDHQGFDSGMMVPDQMAFPSLGMTQPSGPIISGRMLQEHDDLRQKERKEKALQLVSQIIHNVLEKQPSIDSFRAFVRSRSLHGSVSTMVWNHPALAQWRKQKNMELMAEVQEQARSIQQLNFNYSALLMLAQQRGRTSDWINEVAECANGLGWDAGQKRAEMTRGIQQVAQGAVAKNVSWINMYKFIAQKNYPKLHVNALFREMERRGWNIQQKQAEYRGQQMMQGPNALAAQDQSLSPVQQRQGSLSAQQQPTAMMMATSPRISPMQDQNSLANQMQSPFRNQTMSSPQQMQRQRSMTPAGVNGSSPSQQASHKQYTQGMLHQQKAQEMGFLPTPSPGLSSGQTEAFQTQMQNASNHGQGVPVYPNQMGVPVAVGGSFEMFSNSPSPYKSRAPGGEPTASPSRSARKDTASPGKATAKGKGNRPSKEPEPWEKHSGILYSSSGTSYEQPQANNTAPTARMVAKRPAEDQVQPETSRSKRRGTRAWESG